MLSVSHIHFPWTFESLYRRTWGKFKAQMASYLKTSLYQKQLHRKFSSVAQHSTRENNFQPMIRIPNKENKQRAQEITVNICTPITLWNKRHMLKIPAIQQIWHLHDELTDYGTTLWQTGDTAPLWHPITIRSVTLHGHIHSSSLTRH